MKQTELILQAIKGLLKQHKLNYSHVAAHLDLSESSVKRSFSQGQISLSRLIKICEMMDLELVDLLQVIQNQSSDIIQLTEKQEKLMVSDVKLLLVTVCVCNHWTFKQIHQTYQIEEAELVNVLLRLDRTDLIELKPNNQIKLKISPHFHWIENGPIQKFFEQNIQQDFWQSQFINPGEIRLLVNGMLSKKSNELMQKHINRLKQQFSQLSEQDKTLKLEQRHGTTLVIGMRPWELTLFADLRRQQDLKKYS
ncbi:helix-turn-helix domain-containing protein [Marinicella litoralis]|uniref:Cro/C1-type helix-turn-helix DNA-binding protein n=1 Tax=Marinicella litoralis TaxID=644220 RepID=A0A4R6XQ39_9GAMM|nr:helix-turn-helix domain-containing protein [Marinicella litoralis]TDR18348.1 Cro/C1-type helix-turn-helix DNA-binding protein [Marinicella litoralis]